MKTTYLEYINADHRNALLSHLKGRIFHLTSTLAFHQIHKDGAIRQNQSGSLQFNTCSEGSFGRMNGWVCLFDFRNITPDLIENTLVKYNFFQPKWFVNHEFDFLESQITYLFLDPAEHGKVIPNSVATKGLYIPYVECWFKGDLPLDKIEEAVSVRIYNNATEQDRMTYKLTNMEPETVS